MNTMNYKDYVARVEYSAEDDCFVGRVAGIDDVMGFHANSVSELHTAFIERSLLCNYVEEKGRDIESMLC